MNARAIIEAELNPRQFLKAVGKTWPGVERRDVEALKAAGFDGPDEQQPYLDWSRHPEGWGKEGTDRNEYIVWDTDRHYWTAMVSHVMRPSNNHWYDKWSPRYDNAEEAVRWMAQDQQAAPKVPSTFWGEGADARHWIKRAARPYSDDALREQFIDFLEHTLIPDLYDSGMEATAEEFETGIGILRREPTQENFQNMEIRLWVRWLQDTWIPDLRRSGNTETANDVDTMIRFIAGRGYWVHPSGLSYDRYPNRMKGDDDED